MSNAGIINTQSGPAPITVVETITVDTYDETIPFTTGTIATADNNIQLLAYNTANNTLNGLFTDVHGNNTKFGRVYLSNRATGSVTTSDATPTAVITLDLSSINAGVSGVYTFDINIAGYATAGTGAPLGCGYTIVGAIRYDGVSANLIPNQVVDHFEEGALGTAPQATAQLSYSGTNAVVQVTGKAAYTIKWQATLTYVLSS